MKTEPSCRVLSVRSGYDGPVSAAQGRRTIRLVISGFGLVCLLVSNSERSPAQTSIAVTDFPTRAVTSLRTEPEKDQCDFSSYRPVRIYHFDSKAILKRVEPDYPPEAAEQGIQGPVLVKALVNETGEIERACAVEGERLLRGPAEVAALQWKLKPKYGLAFRRPITQKNLKNLAEIYIQFDFRSLGIWLRLLSIENRSMLQPIKSQDHFEVPRDDLVLRFRLTNTSSKPLYYLEAVSSNEPVGYVLFRKKKEDSWKSRSPSRGRPKQFIGDAYHWVLIPAGGKVEFEVLDLSTSNEDHAVTLFVNDQPTHAGRVEIISQPYHPKNP